MQSSTYDEMDVQKALNHHVQACAGPPWRCYMRGAAWYTRVLPARFRLSLGCGHASHGCVFRGWYVCKAVIGRGCGQFTPRASGLIPPLLLLLLLLCCCCSCCRGGWVHLPRACTLVITLVESEVHLTRARTSVESGLTPLPPLRRAHHPSHSRRVG